MATPRLTGATIVCCLLIAHASLALAEPGRAAALADLEINEPVDGDVVVLAGTVVLGPEARVRGHVVAVFGEVRQDPAARVDGRIIAVSSLAGVRLAGADDAASRRLEAAVNVLASGCWLLATTLVAFAFPGRVRFGVWLMPTIGLKVLVLGVLVLLTLFAALVAAIGLGPTLGVPLVAAIFVLFLIAKAGGLAVLGATLGGRLLTRITDVPLPVTVEVFVGVVVMLMMRLVPLAGEILWTALSVVAVGAVVFTVALGPQRGAVETARSGGAPRQ